MIYYKTKRKKVGDLDFEIHIFPTVFGCFQRHVWFSEDDSFWKENWIPAFLKYEKIRVDPDYEKCYFSENETPDIQGFKNV